MGVDVATKQVVWVKARPDFDLLFQLLNNMRVNNRRRFWIVYPEAEENICGAGEGLGQVGMEVEIPFPISHNVLTIVEEYVQ